MIGISTILPAGSWDPKLEIDYVLICELPDLVWLANLAAIELHVPQWKAGPRGKVHGSDLVVFDLDPGAPASITECCEVALRLREELAADGLDAYPKTSGSKGMQLYAPIKPAPEIRNWVMYSSPLLVKTCHRISASSQCARST